MEFIIDRYMSAGKTSEPIDLIFRVASCADLKTMLHAALALAESGIYPISVIKRYLK